MKTWQWILLGLAAVGIIVIIEKKNTAQAVQAAGGAGALNSTAALGAGLGGLLAGLFNAGNKVSAPGGGYVAPGSSSVWDPSGSAAAPPTSTSGDPFGIGSLSFGGQASGGTNVGGGLTTAQSQPSGDPFGLGSLTAPNFSIGTGGADFTS